MHTVWKIQMTQRRTVVELPRGARFLSIGEQVSIPCLWFEVDTDQPMGRRTLEAVGTGDEIPRGGTFLATHQYTNYGGGSMFVVHHIYEVPND